MVRRGRNWGTGLYGRRRAHTGGEQLAESREAAGHLPAGGKTPTAELESRNQKGSCHFVGIQGTPGER